jgi:hypothetical protein
MYASPTSEQDILAKNASGLYLCCTGLNLHYQPGIKTRTKYPASGTETIIFGRNGNSAAIAISSSEGTRLL